MSKAEDERRLVLALLSRAEEERRQILEQARIEAQGILREAEAQVKSLTRERIEAARQRARREVARRMSQARFEKAAAEVRILDEAVDQALAMAREELAAIRHRPAYAPLLRRLLEECLGEFPRGVRLRLEADPRDEGVLRAVLPNPDPAGMQIEPAGPFLGGLRASDPEGSLVVDNTFEARLRALLPRVRQKLALIFGTERSGA